MADYDEPDAIVTLRDTGGDVQCVPAWLENVIIILKNSGYTVVEASEGDGDDERIG